MDHPASLQNDPPLESHGPSRPGGSAAHLPAKKPSALRIVVPPTEYCPFSTDLTLPITPLSLPTPVSSSCFTFSDTQELVSQSALPTPAGPPRDTAVTDFTSPTSSQFLLMPHVDDADSGTAICVSSPAPPTTATDQPTPIGSCRSKSGNLRPWEVSSSTWLTDLGGHTQTDRIFRHNPLEMSDDTDSSPASTPALSPSAVSPSSHVSSVLAYNLPTSRLAGSPASLPPALSPYSCTMSLQPSSPARLALKPTGTDTFPSTLDSLETWREGVMPGVPRSEEPHSPLSEEVHDARFGEPAAETTVYPSFASHHSQSHRPSPRPRVSRSQTLMKHAKMFGGRVKQLVRRQNVNKHRVSMDRGLSFRIMTSQDSENGSVILITAPPPPYDDRLQTIASNSRTGQEHIRPRTTSEYSSAVQESTVEHTTAGATESDSRQADRNRNALRRLSIAALSSMTRH